MALRGPDVDERVYPLPHSLLIALAGYLAKRPYEEVFELIAALRQLKPLEKD